MPALAIVDAARSVLARRALVSGEAVPDRLLDLQNTLVAKVAARTGGSRFALSWVRMGRISRRAGTFAPGSGRSSVAALAYA